MEIKKTLPNSTPILFTNPILNSNNQDDDINSKYQKRQENFKTDESLEKIKENTMSNELSLGQNYRNKIFAQKRLKKSMNIESTNTLKSQLTIPIQLFESCNRMPVEISKFPEIIKAFRTQDIIQKYTGLVGIRRLLSLQTSPIQELIDIGITPELISLLDNSPPEFQYEALWCLTNIATGTSDQANSIVVKGGIPKIIRLMESSIEELKEQATWIIGNLASDCQKIRDTLIREKAFDKLITILASTSHPNLIKQTTWAIGNFFRVKPSPPFDIVKKCIKTVSRAMIILQNEKEFLIDACFILYFMTEHYKETINELLEIGIIPNIIQNLDIQDTHIQINCLRIVGNIASGNANQTQSLIDWGLLQLLKKTIFNTAKQIRKESAWIISNIAAGTQKQIETLISLDFLPILAKVIQSDETEIKKESIWAVCNLTSVENPDYIKKILEQGILNIICDCLKLDDAKYLAVCLEAFGNLLAFGKKNNPEGLNPIVNEVDKMGMFDVLEKLQYHPVEVVYEKTLKILETYFETESVE
jgi:hypothetical protein